MDQQILQEAGLTEAQAAAYTTLVKHSPCTPPKLATLINESRTNTYKILEQLEDMGLVSRDETQKKLRYWANNPSLLVDIIKKRRLEAEETEKRYKDSLPGLMDEYFKHSERPGVRYFQGLDGLQQIYEDQLSECQDIEFVRSTADTKLYGYEVMRKMRGKFPSSGIKRHAFSPDAPDIPINWRELDAPRLLERTWLGDGYTAPVEWTVYGNKVSIISFGEEAVGMIIESKQIAESLRQLLKYVDDGAKANPKYRELPKRANAVITDNDDLELPATE
jgi:hypothetical protein